MHDLSGELKNLAIEACQEEEEETTTECGEGDGGQLEDEIADADRDPEIEEFAKRFKAVYEHEFVEYLQSEKVHKNDTICATSLPTGKYCKETFEQESMNSLTLNFHFDKVDVDENGNIQAIVAETFDRSETCHFQPTLCKNYGPYHKTLLFTCVCTISRKSIQGPVVLFLDLPLELYNLIELDDD